MAEETDVPPPPKPVLGGNFNHGLTTLEIMSRLPKSNQLLILSQYTDMQIW